MRLAGGRCGPPWSGSPRAGRRRRKGRTPHRRTTIRARPPRNAGFLLRLDAVAYRPEARKQLAPIVLAAKAHQAQINARAEAEPLHHRDVGLGLGILGVEDDLVARLPADPERLRPNDPQVLDA